MLCEKIRTSLKKYGMLGKCKRIAVAFSGGADSVALLHFLHCEGYSPYAIHVNHGIRGDEADADEEFCRTFCEKYGIPLVTVSVDVPAEAKASGEGLEEAARRLRYTEIERIMREKSIDMTATAHHADDNMETVLFNLTRGSSIRGAGGIPPVRQGYIRPLIEATRQDILDYCKENSLEFVTDSTNYDTDYTRNFIRHKITPLLKEINPEAAAAFTLFSRNARRDNEFINSIAQNISKSAKRNELAQLHPALLYRFIYMRCEELGHIPSNRAAESLIHALMQGNEYKSIDMGAGIKAVCDRNELRFIRGEEASELGPFILSEGENDLGAFGRIYIAKTEKRATELKNIYKISAYTLVSSVRIKGDIFARSRIPGDSYRCGNMTRSLKKLYNSKKLTVNQRSTLPLICDENGILWIPGFMPRDGLKTDENKNLIFIGYKR